jgi:hypothetical protein
MEKRFRWRIPQLPSSDSIEFSFRAVNPASDQYEVSLYKSERVIIQTIHGEPATTFRSGWRQLLAGAVSGILMAFALFAALPQALPKTTHVTSLTGDCALTVVSSFERLDDIVIPPWSGPWVISYRVINTGSQKCIVQSEQLTGGAEAVVLPGEEFRRTVLSASEPLLIREDLTFGSSSLRKAPYAVYKAAGEVKK